MKDLCLTQYTEKIAPMVFRENHRQLEKWGVQDHEPVWWLAFANEELGELSKAISEFTFRGGLAEDVVKEAIQTATLCLKIAEMFNALLVTKVCICKGHDGAPYLHEARNDCPVHGNKLTPRPEAL